QLSHYRFLILFAYPSPWLIPPAAEPFIGPGLDPRFTNRLARILLYADKEPHVVQRHQPHAELLTGGVQVPDVGAAVRPAREAVARRVERPLVQPEPSGLCIDLAAVAYPRSSVPAVACGRDTVEQV